MHASSTTVRGSQAGRVTRLFSDAYKRRRSSTSRSMRRPFSSAARVHINRSRSIKPDTAHMYSVRLKSATTGE